MLRNKKIILCDVDGVVINGRPQDNKRWDTELEKDIGISPKDLQEKYFLNYWPDIIVGNKDLKECLVVVISTINKNIRGEDLINYWFKNDSAVNIDFLNLLTEITNKNSGAPYLATNQEKYRTNYVYHELGLNKYFNDIFCSGEVGFKKDEDGYWEYIKKKFGKYDISQLFLVDDTPKNIEKAKQHGIDGYLYTTFEKAEEELFKNI